MQNDASPSLAPATSQSARVARKKSCRRNLKDRLQVAKSLNAHVGGHRALLQQRQKTNGARRWLHRQYGAIGSNAISEQSRKRLLAFWSRSAPDDGWVTTISDEGKVEELPDFDDETLAHWRRFETAWGAGRVPTQAKKKGRGKKRVAVTVEGEWEEDEEEGGVKIEADEKDLEEEEDGGDDMMEDYDGPPEPVSADEYDSDHKK